MNAFYDVTILLNIGLLAIVVAIFVLGASLLGRAIKEFSETEENALKTQKEQLSKDIENLQIQVHEMAVSNDIKTFKKQIKELENRRSKNELELKQIQTKPKLLTVNGSVVYPAALFLVSLLLSVGAKLFPQAWLSVPMWLLSIIFVGFGCYRVYQSLRVIEKVAITTEKAYLRSMKDAFETALESREEAKRVLLKLEFIAEKPPLSLKSGSEKKIEFRIGLIQGDVAENVGVLFFAPEGCAFPKAPTTWRQSVDFRLPNALTTEIKFETVTPGVNKRGNVTLTLPSTIGDYTFFYRFNCKGFDSGLQEMLVSVV